MENVDRSKIIKEDLSIQYADNMLNLFHDIWNKWHEVKEQVDESNKRQVDLLHKIEAMEHSDEEGLSLLKELRELRIKRRELKNELEKLSVLTTFTRDNIKQLYLMKSEIESKIHFQEQWKYKFQTEDKMISHKETK